MSRMISLAGLIGICLMLTTCGGTVRAIDDDYADDYIIRNIRPVAGVSGEEVLFEFAICENAGAVPFDGENPPQVIWDFGTGAEPNISFEQNPTVTLRDGIRSPYQGKLTVRYGCENEKTVTADFTLNVAPLSVLGVAPLTGAANGTATFSALIGSGNATTYAWDFGGACSPNGSNLPNPAVNFSADAGGIYYCRVLVSNNFEVTEFPFTLQVTPAPAD